MLQDLERDDWLSILKIPEERIPLALVLRETWNLKSNYQEYWLYITNHLQIGTPIGILKEVFIGYLTENSFAYASAYGASMASEVAHVFGILGYRLVIQASCCSALIDEIVPGDPFIASEAFCGDEASHHYLPEKKTVAASFDTRECIAKEEILHTRHIYTTSALIS